ncbi:MAG: YbjQ family protein [Nitrospirota bacterium]|nr:YbjQ family protein [Nitrospirota bacterium]
MAVEIPQDIGILMTTETVPGFPIQKLIGVITAECVFGMHLFKDIFAAVTDIVGGRSNASQQVFRDARDSALRELQ